MRQVGEALLRVMRTLAGLAKDEPWTALHVALYGFLGLVAVALALAWLTGTPLECVTGAVCER